MSDPDAAFNSLAEVLDDLGLKRRPIFGHRGLALLDTGKVFCCLVDGELVVRLPRDGEEHAEALGLKGSRVFEPMEGRPMRDWVCVPVAHEGQWEPMARAAARSLG
jgi:hypothetical protein